MDANWSLEVGGGGYSQYTWQGGPMYLFGLKIYTLGICLGQEICHVSFKVLKSVWLNQSVLRYSSLVCLGGEENFDAKNFLGVKFQAHVFFGVLSMKPCRTPPPPPPPVMYTTSTPLGIEESVVWCFIDFFVNSTITTWGKEGEKQAFKNMLEQVSPLL